MVKATFTTVQNQGFGSFDLCICKNDLHHFETPNVYFCVYSESEMFGEDSVDDVRCSLLVAVDFVAIDVIGGHRVAVADDQLQHGGRKVFVRHADKGMSQFVYGGCNAVLCGV